MKIIVAAWSLLWFGILATPPEVSARESVMESTETPAKTPAEQKQTEAAAATQDYTAYIRPLDKLRTELSQQQALLETVVDISAQIDQLQNREIRSDILVLFDENLSQAERIKAVLSDTGAVRSDDFASIRAEIDFLKQMYIQTLQVQQASAPDITDAATPWALASSIQYVQTMDNGTAGLVAVTTGTGAPVVLHLGESTRIAGKTIALDSVKPASGGRIGIHFVIDGKPKTIYYPQ